MESVSHNFDSLPEYKNYTVRTIVPGELYHWCDDSPHVGLHQVCDLSIEEKRSELFGRSDVSEYLLPEHQQAAVLFDTHVYLDIKQPAVNQIFFPSLFLCQCQLFKNHYRDWSWSLDRTVAVTCPMRWPRYARVVASCWLSQHRDQVSFAYTQNWEPESRISQLYELLQIGGLKDWTNTWGPELSQLPFNTAGEFELTGTDSMIFNFEKLHPNLYSDAAAAAVIGAVFWEHGAELDEKYVNAVYSGCIPILHGYGVYQRLAQLGFDTFDDVIDTSSQWETNPVLAAWNMWEQNLDFFKSATDIVRDPQIQQRLRNNLNLCRNGSQLFDNIVNSVNTAAAAEVFRNNQSAILDYFEQWHTLELRNFLGVK